MNINPDEEFEQLTVEEDSQARQARQGETWENNAVEFLEAISWGDDNG